MREQRRRGENVERYVAAGVSAVTIALGVTGCTPVEVEAAKSSAVKANPVLAQAKPAAQAAAIPRTPGEPNCHQKLILNEQGYGTTTVTDPLGKLAQVAISPYKGLVEIRYQTYTLESGPPENIYKDPAVVPNIIAEGHDAWYKLDEKYGVTVTVLPAAQGQPRTLVADCVLTPEG